MNISLLFTVAVALFALILGLVNMIKAGKRSWLMAVIRLGITAFSMVASVPVTMMLLNEASDYAYELVIPMLPAALGGFFTEVPVGAEGMRVIASLLIAPVVFLLVFILMRWALSVVAWVIEKIIPPLRKRSLRGLSRLLGLANGVLVAVVVLIPLAGYLMLSTHAVRTVVESDLTDSAVIKQEILEPMGMTEEELVELSSAVESHPVIATVYNTVGKPVFDSLTNATLDATETHGAVIQMNLETELCGLVRTAGYAMEVMESFEKDDYTDADKQLLFATADSFFSSDWIKMVMTDTLVAMSENWINGEAFAGMDRPKLDATLNPTLNTILELLSTENGETLEEDIHVILDVVGDLKANHLLEENADYTAMVQKMGSSGLLTDMLEKLEANQRMSSLAAELKALSIRLVTNMLGTDLLKGGEYSEMMGNVAGTLTDALTMNKEERDALVVESIQNNFKESGFDVPPEVALKMSDQIINDLGADGEITSDELTEYLVNHADEGFEFVPDELPDNLPV